MVLGAPSTLELVVEQFAATLGLSNEAQRIFSSRLESRFGSNIWRPCTIFRRCASRSFFNNTVQNVSFDLTAASDRCS